MLEKTKEYSFKISMREQDAQRFEAFAQETGMKKLAIVRKAILRYIEEKEQDSVS